MCKTEKLSKWPNMTILPVLWGRLRPGVQGIEQLECSHAKRPQRGQNFLLLRVSQELLPPGATRAAREISSGEERLQKRPWGAQAFSVPDLLRGFHQPQRITQTPGLMRAVRVLWRSQTPIHTPRASQVKRLRPKNFRHTRKCHQL